MSANRARLAALAAAAGYPGHLFPTIAAITCGGYRPGEPLTDAEVNAVATAVRVLARAGIAADALPHLVAHYQHRHGPDGSSAFWQQMLRLANYRHNHRDLYAPSPCEPHGTTGPTATPEGVPLMTEPPSAVADADAPATRAPTSAADLAARIQIPRRLPVRYDGRPLRHLSNSSYTLFVACPEAWRRRYLKGERTPPTGAMFLGSRVDDAVTDYYRHQLEHGNLLNLDQVQDLYRDRWHQQLAAEETERGVHWEPDLPEPAAFQMGLDALAITFSELIPRLGRPVAVQRKLEFALSPQAEWTVQCWLDLETIRDDDADGSVAEVVDYKVKTTSISQAKADDDPQAALYLAGRWLEGRPARAFTFAQVAKPGARRKQMSATLITTTRTVAEQRACLARIAQAAGHVVALYERFGPDAPWPFADPTGWRCSDRYCHAWRSCPGGAGL